MSVLLKLAREEPAVIVSVVLAVLNMVFTLSAEQALNITTLVESILLLIAGGVVRQSVYSPATVDDIREGLKP